MTWLAKLTDGLYPFEVVLLVLGVLFFFVLLLAFLRNVFRDKPYGVMLPFFLLPIAMIGYPSVQSIAVSQDTVTIAVKTSQLVQNPNDQNLRASLQSEVAKVSARPIRDAQTAATLAEAQFALGDDVQSQANLQRALNADPNQPAAKKLQNKIQLTQKLNTLTTQAQNQPADANTKAALQNTVVELQKTGVANPVAVKKMAEAQMLLKRQ